MSEKHYKTITVTRTKRVRVKDLHFINGNLADITFQERRRVKKPVKPGELTFHENGCTIIWEDDSIRLSPATFRLVQQLWIAPDRFLSKEDIRQDVIEDDDARDVTLRNRTKEARGELKKGHFPYEIVTVHGKGCRLASRSQEQEVDLPGGENVPRRVTKSDIYTPVNQFGRRVTPVPYVR